jgi:hypothetical protein
MFTQAIKIRINKFNTNSPISGIILTHLRNKHVFNAIIRTFYRTLTLWVARFGQVDLINMQSLTVWFFQVDYGVSGPSYTVKFETVVAL